MKRSPVLPAVVVTALLLSCGNNHLIADKSFRNLISDDYSARVEKYASVRGDLFGLVDTIREDSRREAVMFLLAYMPLSDLAVYEPGFLLANVDAALKARREMTWGPTIPDDIFLHFVLPPRVNNENPDSFRLVMYDELTGRIEGLDPQGAALEINRWCHEKVSYQPSDIRTSSPMATMLSARGRCGEESTLTVAALRTAGLPARQVYTPRWAHSDDNHAWVEVWINGRWHYMGACEPELVLDRGWFTEPARRAMLIHTRAFGRYTGSEPLVKRENMFSELNTLRSYAVTKELRVSVTDGTGDPVRGADVSYLIYNYAEFYTLALLRSDNEGECSLTTGLGALLVWADDGTRCGYTYAAPADTSVKVVLTDDHPSGTAFVDMTAPPVLTPFPPLDEEMVRKNNLLLKQEDSIRQSYINSWMSDIQVSDLSASAGVSEERIMKALRTSMGNYRNIARFLGESAGNGGLAVRLLENIAEKDLRDTPHEILYDHLVNAPENKSWQDEGFYDAYVLSPRIDNEILSPFRSSLKSMTEDLQDQFAADPLHIAGWIDTAIAITDTENYYNTPVIPSGVVRLRTADRHSRDILFVALCRTLGHPARLEPGTGRPQYRMSGEWNSVWFTGDPRPSDRRSFVTFTTGEKNPEPEYHTHFSLAVLENGKYRPLDYGYNVRITNLPVKIPLDPARYLLVTGNRDENGDVLASLSFLELKSDEDIKLDVTLRKKDKAKLSGKKINTAATLLAWSGDDLSLDTLVQKGVVLIWLEPGKEPTRHILNDLPLLKKEFDKWGGFFIFLTDPSSSSASFSPEDIEGLPERSLFALDRDLKFMLSVLDNGTVSHPLPVVICADSEGNVLFTSDGYRIGTGEQILKNINNR